MDPAGLLGNIFSGTSDIDKGRKYLARDGLEHAGRIFYEEGIATALDAFKNAQASADPKTMILVELAFLDTVSKWRQRENKEVE